MARTTVAKRIITQACVKLKNLPIEDETSARLLLSLSYCLSVLAKGIHYGYPSTLPLIEWYAKQVISHTTPPSEGDWTEWLDLEELEVILKSIEGICVGTKMHPTVGDYRRVVSPRTSEVQELHNAPEKGSGTVQQTTKGE